MGNILYNFTIMNSLPFCLVFVFVSLSSATKELQLPPIPLSLFHPPADFEPSQFLIGQKFNGNNFDSNQLPPFLQKILGGVAQVVGKFPFIQDWFVQFESTQDAILMRGGIKIKIK